MSYLVHEGDLRRSHKVGTYRDGVDPVRLLRKCRDAQVEVVVEVAHDYQRFERVGALEAKDMHKSLLFVFSEGKTGNHVFDLKEDLEGGLWNGCPSLYDIFNDEGHHTFYPNGNGGDDLWIARGKEVLELEHRRRLRLTLLLNNSVGDVTGNETLPGTD
jgi:hypothetical protein